jgi:hypothetical protein
MTAMKNLTLNSKIICGSLIALSFLYVRPQPAKAQLNCRVVETLGNSLQSQILTELNNHLAGQRERINRRKELQINHIENVAFNGCRMTTTVNVTLKRKIRRDAHGTVQVGADITTLNIPNRQLCYNNARVSNINLSRTLIIGETVYKWVANAILPNNGCFGA